VRLVDYLLSIPAVPWCAQKYILRRALKDRLPAAVLHRPKTPLISDPALQLARRAGVRWRDHFEVTPQLTRFVNLSSRRSPAEETPNALWARLRVFALNHWLTHSLPLDRRMVA
jgi:asparagine synthase (glutamine-hydrolysing)